MKRIPLWTIAAAVLVLVGATAAASALRRDRPYAARVTAQLNEARTANGLPKLRVSYRLRGGAAGRALDLARRGYFAHRTPDGEPFWHEVRRSYPSAGYRFWSVGENLYWRSDVRPPAHVIESWLASPTHRANMLNGKWREVGITVVRSTSAPGVFAGQPVVIVTAEFGVRRR